MSEPRAVPARPGWGRPARRPSLEQKRAPDVVDIRGPSSENQGQMRSLLSLGLVVVFAAANWLALICEVSCDFDSPNPTEVPASSFGEQGLPSFSLSDRRDQQRFESTDENTCGGRLALESFFSARSSSHFNGISILPEGSVLTLRDGPLPQSQTVSKLSRFRPPSLPTDGIALRVWHSLCLVWIAVPHLDKSKLL